MSRSKKIVGLVLAVVLMLGSFTMAFAATDPGAGNYTATVAVTPAADTIGAGESTTVTVKATTNFTVGALSVPLFYEKANVTVSDIAIPATAGYAYSTDATATDAASIFASAGLDSATYGFVMVTYIPAAGAATKVFTDEQVLSFTVTAKAGVADGTAVNFKTVDASRKTSTNPTGTLYVGFINSDTINAVPTNIEATGLVTSATVTIGSAMTPADLELTATGSTDGVVIDTRITFGGQYTGVVYGFKQVAGTTFRANNTYITNALQATNGGSLSIERSFNTAGWGTGTTITVKNSDGTDSGKVFVVVIFGDVNADGLINANDTTACKGYVSKPATLTNKVVRMAANCQNIANGTMLYNVNANDTTAVKAYVTNTSAKVSQATLAATFKKTAVNANYA